MNRSDWKVFQATVALLALAASAAMAQTPYIGFVYPAGGRQGDTFQVQLGGQAIEGVKQAVVSGTGVKARLVEYNKRMNNQEMQLLNEQLRELRRIPPAKLDTTRSNLIVRLQKFIADYVQQPACASIANLAVVEVTIAPDAEPGPREIRLLANRGLTNPLVFHVGQLPEVTATPAITCRLVTLGKEALSLRKKTRPAPDPAAMMSSPDAMMATTMMAGPGALSAVDDDEVRVSPPCTINGQITPGSVDRYRFEARKGQRLVVQVMARELVPYMADAVPGWFQPVVRICDATGREVAYKDDYRFKPDPVLLCEVPADGEYVLAIHDAIFRGREDFVYRITLGETPFVTGIFPLGGRAGTSTTVEVKGWNLTEDRVTPPLQDRSPGVHAVVARGSSGWLSNRVPFALDTLPETVEKEPNSQKRTSQRVSLPVIVNGRIDKPGDRDVYQFEGRAGDTVVAEVYARRLDSPMDSAIKLMDASDKVLAINDDREDPGSGLNTHHADSYLRATLPADGIYYLQIADTQHNGGEEFAYRVRISAPQVDFALRVVPSCVTLRGGSSVYPTVHLIRNDGFAGPIRLAMKNAPPGIEFTGATFTGTQTTARVTIKTNARDPVDPFNLVIEGLATNGTETVSRPAVPAEDRMQAFLWRHLVPAQELKAAVLAAPPTPPKPATPPKKSSTVTKKPVAATSPGKK